MLQHLLFFPFHINSHCQLKSAGHKLIPQCTSMMWHLLIMRVNNWKSPHMHFSNILCKKKTVQGTRNSKMLNKRMFFLLRKSWESSKSKQAIGTIYPCFVMRNSGKQLPPIVPGLFSVAQLAHTAYCSHSVFIPFCKAQTTQHPTKTYATPQH